MFLVKLARSKWMHITMLVLLTVFVYWNSIPVGFIGDDFHQVYVSRDCNVLCSLTNVFLAFGRFYRPVHLLFYRLAYLVAGYNPIFYHIVSIGLHVGVVLLLYWLMLSLGHGYPEAVLAAFLFAVDPIHTNAVSWLAGVNESLMALWLLLSVICYVWSTWTPSCARVLLLLSVLSFCLALLSKENAVVLPVILAMYEVLVRRQSLVKWRTWGSRLIPYALMSILYYGYSRGVLGAPGVELGKSVYTYALGPGVMQNVVYYGLALFSPVDLYPLLGRFEEMGGAVMKGARTPMGMVLLGVVAIIFLVGLSWWWRCVSRMTRFWLIWIPVSLLPVLILGHASELYLYLPSMGSSALMAILATHLYRTTARSPRRWMRVAPIGAILAVGVVYSLSTIHRNQVYLQVGSTAEDIITQVREKHPRIPDSSQLYFANEPHVEQGLSIMGLRGVDVLSPWAVSAAMKIAYQNDSVSASLLDFEDMTAMLGQADCCRANCYYFVWAGSELEERTCEP
jgi:hypothetical protein